MFNFYDFVIGVILSLPIGYASIKKKALTNGGVLFAFMLGVIVAGFGGITWFLILLTFYITSSIITKYKKQAKSPVIDKFQKGGQRDIGQVLANGLVALIMVILENIYFSEIFFAGFIGAIATVTADTWGTELGILSKHKPILITTLKPVEPGTSGAVSKLGILATITGSLCIGIIGFFSKVGELILEGSFSVVTSASLTWILIAGLIGGVIGATADSFLGATVQAMFYCDICQKETEKKVHTCGNKTRHIRGVLLLDNDGVNLVSSLVGALAAMMIYLWFFSMNSLKI